MARKPKGWKGEPVRHGLAAKGVKTKRMQPFMKPAVLPAQHFAGLEEWQMEFLSDIDDVAEGFDFREWNFKSLDDFQDALFDEVEEIGIAHEITEEYAAQKGLGWEDEEHREEIYGESSVIRDDLIERAAKRVWKGRR